METPFSSVEVVKKYGLIEVGEFGTLVNSRFSRIGREFGEMCEIEVGGDRYMIPRSHIIIHEKGGVSLPSDPKENIPCQKNRKATRRGRAAFVAAQIHWARPDLSVFERKVQEAEKQYKSAKRALATAKRQKNPSKELKRRVASLLKQGFAEWFVIAALIKEMGK